jgi:hypothetical protein
LPVQAFAGGKMSIEAKRPFLSNPRWSWCRPLKNYSKIQALYSKLIRGGKFQLNKIMSYPKCYLNVGCGQNPHQNFINLDYHWRPNIELYWDITKGLPMASCSIKGIFSEHGLSTWFFPKATC